MKEVEHIPSVGKSRDGGQITQRFWNICSCGWKGRIHFIHNDQMFTNLREEFDEHIKNSTKIKEMKETKLPYDLLRERVDIDFRIKLLNWFGFDKFTISDVRKKLREDGDVDFHRRYREAFCGGENTSDFGFNWLIEDFANRTQRHIERSIRKYGGRRYVEYVEVTKKRRNGSTVQVKQNIRYQYQLDDVVRTRY